LNFSVTDISELDVCIFFKDLLRTIHVDPTRPTDLLPFYVSNIGETEMSGCLRRGLQIELFHVDEADIMSNKFKAYVLPEKNHLLIQMPTAPESYHKDSIPHKACEKSVGTFIEAAHNGRQVLKNRIADTCPNAFFLLVLEEEADPSTFVENNVHPQENGTVQLKLHACVTKESRTTYDKMGQVLDSYKEVWSVYWRVMFLEDCERRVETKESTSFNPGHDLVSKLAGQFNY